MVYRQKIIKEKAVPKVEGYMFEEHDLVRAAATECMCNLILSPEVRPRFTIDLKQLVFKSQELSHFSVSVFPFFVFLIPGAETLPGYRQRPIETFGTVQW